VPAAAAATTTMNAQKDVQNNVRNALTPKSGVAKSMWFFLLP
jgi:hypothetical protein